jgi:hypothetical protein
MNVLQAMKVFRVELSRKRRADGYRRLQRDHDGRPENRVS